MHLQVCGCGGGGWRTAANQGVGSPWAASVAIGVVRRFVRNNNINKCLFIIFLSIFFYYFALSFCLVFLVTHRSPLLLSAAATPVSVLNWIYPSWCLPLFPRLPLPFSVHAPLSASLPQPCLRTPGCWHNHLHNESSNRKADVKYTCMGLSDQAYNGDNESKGFRPSTFNNAFYLVKK